MRVYILSSYEEHGAENVIASLSPKTLIEMKLREDKALNESVDKDSINWPEENRTSYINRIKEQQELENKKLKELLDSGEIHSSSGAELSDGWGGWQLHVVELQ